MEEKLSKAIISGDQEFLKLYLDQGGNFNTITLESPDGYGVKAIELAVLSQITYKGSNEITKFIMENSSQEILAEVLISFASEDEYIQKMKILLDSGVFVDLMHNNVSALQRSTGNRNLKMVHLLLTYGADPNKKGEYGTALEEANKISYEPAYKEMMEAFLKGQPKSPFDFINIEEVKKQIINWSICLDKFGKDNKEQTFYVLAIDGNTLKANSEEAFQSTLKQYKEDYPGSYNQQEKINQLKFNPGDFSFHQIVKEKKDSFDNHIKLDFSFLDRLENDNRTREDLLIEGLLINKEILTKEMNKTIDFKIIAPNHVY